MQPSFRFPPSHRPKKTPQQRRRKKKLVALIHRNMIHYNMMQRHYIIQNPKNNKGGAGVRARVEVGPLLDASESSPASRPEQHHNLVTITKILRRRPKAKQEKQSACVDRGRRYWLVNSWTCGRGNIILTVHTVHTERSFIREKDVSQR